MTMPDEDRAPAQPGALQPGAGMPRRRVLRIVALSLLALASTAALMVAGGVAAWNSETGTRWLLAHLPGIAAVDVQGALGRGDLRVGSLRALEGNLQVDIDALNVQGLRLAFRPAPGVWLGVRMDTWEAASVHIATRNARAPSPGTPAPPTTLRSPVSLVIDHLHVGQVALGEAPPLRDLSARLELGADGGRVHRVDGLQATWERVAAKGHLLIHTDTPMGVEAALTAHDTADLARAPLPSPILPHWAADLSLAGPLQALDLAAHLHGGDTASGGSPEVDLQARLTPFAALPLAAITATTRALDLASLTRAAPTTQLTGRIVLATSRPAVADIDLANAIPQAWSAGGLPIAHVTARLETPWNAESLTLPMLRIALADAHATAGEVRAQGRWMAGSAQLQVDLADVQPGRLDERLGAWRVSGPLRIEASGVPAPNASWSGGEQGLSKVTPSAAQASRTSQTSQASQALPASPALPSPSPSPSRSPAPTASAARAFASAPGLHPPPPWSAHLTGHLTGAMPPLQSGPHAPTPPPLALTLDAQATPSALDLRALTLQAGAATASAKAALARTGDDSWRGTAHAQWAQLDPSQWVRLADSGPLHDGPHRLTGGVDLTLQDVPMPWRGLAALRGHAEMTLAASQFAGLPIEGRATVTAGAAPWTLAGELHSGPNTASVDATLAPESMDSGIANALRHVHLQADLPDVAELRPLSPQRWPNTGQAHFDLAADGAGPAWQALVAGAPALQSGPLLALTSTGEATGWAGDGVRLDALHWSVHVPGEAATPVTAEITLHDARWGAAGIASATARLTGTAADHTLHVEADAPLSPPDWLANLAGIGVANATHLDTTLQGHWGHAGTDTPQWQGHLAGLTLRAVTIDRSPSAAPGPPWLTVQPVDFSLARDAAGHWRTWRAGAGAVEVAGLA
ncbi:MAG TPA: hypothetical protein VH328_14350, partial [Burkholderiaceae bacterium]|nr:hypothetical protein [Burkholderiaceae bacterium]